MLDHNDLGFENRPSGLKPEARAQTGADELARLARIWEVEARALEGLVSAGASGADQLAFRECASIYRQCATELKVRLNQPRR